MAKNNSGALKHSIIIAIGTFFLAILFSLSSEVFVQKFNSIFLSFVILLIIILIGIIFDIIGIASTSADESPFHAKCANKVPGASQSLKLIRHADKVASFCNDVVGDICGTVSGALGASIILQVLFTYPTLTALESYLTITITGMVAALTVGGKAYGKSFGITRANHIIFQVGKFLAWLEGFSGFDFFGSNKTRKGKGRVKKS